MQVNIEQDEACMILHLLLNYAKKANVDHEEVAILARKLGAKELGYGRLEEPLCLDE